MRLSYLLVFLFNATFWLGVWVLFYLKFTDYAGIGLIESLMIFTLVVTEVPTGAIADLIGKKWTLVLAFLLSGVGNLIMASASGVNDLFVSVFIITLGCSFYSGSMEALIYETLKENNKESGFDKAMANVKTIGAVGAGLASLIGGWLYFWRPELPFLVLGVTHLLAVGPALWLKEPVVNRQAFSWSGYLIAAKNGFKELFKSSILIRQLRLLLLAGAFGVIANEVLVEALLVEYGFTGWQMGIVVALTYVISSVIAQLMPRVSQKITASKLVYILSLVIAGLFVLAGFANFYLGGLIVIIWAGFNTGYETVASVILNNNINSRYRATALSTFSMLKSLPYMIFGFAIGRLMDQFSVKSFSSTMGIVMLVLFLLLGILNRGYTNKAHAN